MDRTHGYSANPQASGRDGGREINLREFGRSGVHLLGRFDGGSGSTMRFAPDASGRLDAADEACDQLTRQIDTHIAGEGIDVPPDDREPIDRTPTVTPESVDLREENINTVIWCTGFSRDYSWTEGLEVDSHGYSVEERGITNRRGLYFVGLHGMYSLGSGLFWGVGADAEHVVEHVARTLPRTPR